MYDTERSLVEKISTILELEMSPMNRLPKKVYDLLAISHNDDMKQAVYYRIGDMPCRDSNVLIFFIKKHFNLNASVMQYPYKIVVGGNYGYNEKMHIVRSDRQYHSIDMIKDCKAYMEDERKYLRGLQKTGKRRSILDI